MADSDWFRNGKWNEKEESNFFKRLTKLRLVEKKASILVIKARSLYETKKPELLRAAIRLFKTAEELNASYQMALGYYYLAKCYEILEEKNNALIYFQKCIEYQEKHPVVVISKSYPAYAEFIVKNRMQDLYPKALELVDRLLSNRYSEEQPCHLSLDNFLYFGVHALVYSDPGYRSNFLKRYPDYIKKRATLALQYVGRVPGSVGQRYGAVPKNHWMIEKLHAIAPTANEEIRKKESKEELTVLIRGGQITLAELIVKKGIVKKYDKVSDLLWNNMKINSMEPNYPCTYEDFLYYGSMAVICDDVRYADRDTEYAKKAAEKALRCFTIPKNHWLLKKLKQSLGEGRRLFYLKNVKNQLVKSKIDISKANGCNEKELKKLQKKFVIGEWKRELRLPSAYIEFLLWMGKNGGEFMKGTDCFYKHLFENNKLAKELLTEDKQELKLPYDAFVFSMHQGYQFHFFRTEFFRNELEKEDPPVYFYLEGQKTFKCVAPRVSRYLFELAKQQSRIRNKYKNSSKM